MIKISYIGAGSIVFGPLIVKDILLSDAICNEGVEISLMDIVAEHLVHVKEKAHYLNEKFKRKAVITTTTNLGESLKGAHFVLCAIEVERYFYWSQDFHIPRKYGFRQVYGENGGPGSVFHALRNIGPLIHIAKMMERLCPEALLINFTNPEHKVCEAVNRLTSVKSVGICHGVFEGISQIAKLLKKPKEEIDALACGINHFTWFQKVKDKKTGADLYSALREVVSKGHPLACWHEFALGRVMFNLYGLWPSPSTNHYAEYVRWGEEFMVSNLHYYYDPMQGSPWKTGHIPEFVYTVDGVDTHRPWESKNIDPFDDQFKNAIISEKPSGEVAIPIIEGLHFGIDQRIAAINVMNNGLIPNLQPDMVVEVPAYIKNKKWEYIQMDALPESVAAMCRVQGSIQKLTTEAYAEKSKKKLIEALLLDVTVNSYHNCVLMAEEMLELQKELLPEMR
jgi:alpha-galactosidase